MCLERKARVRRTTPPPESVVAGWYENATLPLSQPALTRGAWTFKEEPNYLAAGIGTFGIRVRSRRAGAAAESAPPVTGVELRVGARAR